MPVAAEERLTELEALPAMERIPGMIDVLTEARYREPERAAELGRETLAALTGSTDFGSSEDPRELALACGVCRAAAEVLGGDMERAVAEGERCVELAEAYGDRRWQAWGHFWCLYTAHAQAQALGLAVVHGNRAIEVYEQLGDDLELAGALTRTAMEIQDLGDLTTALEYQLRALDLFRSADDARGEAVVLLRVGACYEQLREPRRSFEYWQQAYEGFRQAGSENGVAAVLHNMAGLHSAQGEYERALELLDESLEIKRRLKQPRAVALRLIAMGTVYMDSGQPKTAFPYLEEGMESLREIGASREQALGSIELARAYRLLGNQKQAIEIILEGIELAESIDFEEHAVEAYRTLAELEEEQGNLAAALAAERRYDAVKSRFLDETTARRITEMDTRYQAESRAREIEDLKTDRALQSAEMESERRMRTALLVGFGLILIILALLFNRYRTSVRAARMAETIRNEKAVNARLREIDRLRNEFLANTSHELRTPLYGIMGLAESLLDGTAGELPPTARENLELISSSGSRLSALVGDILDSAKLQRQGLELALAPVHLHALTDIVVTLSAPLVEGRPIELVNRVPTDLPPALADADRVQQILHNLIGNASKFTEQGRVVVVGELVGDELRIEVRDTGIGIAPEQWEEIFDSFHQGDDATDRLYGGTGLGLTISRELARLHGGDLRVESEPGKGSTFYFTLPVASEDDLRKAPEGTAEVPVMALIDSMERAPKEPGTDPSERPRSTAGGSVPGASEADAPRSESAASEEPAATLLVIDDEAVNRRVLSSHLDPHGYRVRSVSSGAEALELLEAESVDLVLLDIMMPHMSGYEVCRRIREKHSREELPVIFLSAKNRAADRIASFEEGANDYLAKPIAKQELLRRVENQLELLFTHRSQVEELKVLRGILTICSGCKKIRDGEGHWDALESYIDSHSEASFSHGLCPTCVSELYPDFGNR